MTVVEILLPESSRLKARRLAGGIARVSGVALELRGALQDIEPSHGYPRSAWRFRPAEKMPFPRSSRRFQIVSLPGGSLGLSWPRVGAFRIDPESRVVRYTLASGASWELFHETVIGPVVSFLILLEKRTPLHASAVQIGSGAVGFVGAPGAGKSTLAATFLLGGHGLITDDLLALTQRRQRFWASPGYPEIRLWPASGRRLFPEAFSRLPTVVPSASKRRVDSRDYPAGFVRKVRPLRVLYEIRRSPKVTRPVITPLGGREAFLTLLKNLYNISFVTPETLEFQFRHLGSFASRVPIRRLALPRGMQPPSEITSAVLRDLERLGDPDL